MSATRERRVFSGSALLLGILLAIPIGCGRKEVDSADGPRRAVRAKTRASQDRSDIVPQPQQRGLDDRPQISAQLGHCMPVTSVAFSPEGRWVLSGSWNNIYMEFGLPVVGE